MPNGFEAFAQNAIALGSEWRERRKAKRIGDAMATFDVDPAGAVTAISKENPVLGWQMRQNIQAQSLAAQEAQRAKTVDALKTVTGLLGPAAMDPNATPQSLGQAYDSIMPILSDGLGMDMGEIAKWKQMFVSNPGILKQLDNEIRSVSPGGALVQGGREIYRNPYPDQIVTVGSDATGRNVLTVPRTFGGGVPSGAGTGTAPAAVGGGVSASSPANPDAAWAFTLSHEGGYSPSDANGQPVNFGINQGAHPNVDVKNLTEDQAKQIYLRDYWGPSGAANLPAPLGVVHADTYYINPQRAKEFLAQSGGDPQRYLELRQAWHDRLVAQNPKKYGRFKKAWTSRVDDLASMIGGSAPASTTGGARTVFSTPAKAGTPGAGYTLLTPQEAAQLGLPNADKIRWQRSEKGEYKPVGGLAQMNPANIAKMEKKQQIYDSITSNMTRMQNAANSLLRHPGLSRASGAMSYVPSLRGGDASNFESDLDALKSQIGFAILNDMRQMSPTGGALGNVSNFEVDTLQRNIAALDISQSPAQLRARIKQIADYAQQLKSRYARAYNTDRSSLLGPQEGQIGGQAAPPRAAIDLLRKNPTPTRKKQFDEIFGQGAAARVLGN